MPPDVPRRRPSPRGCKRLQRSPEKPKRGLQVSSGTPPKRPQEAFERPDAGSLGGASRMPIVPTVDFGEEGRRGHAGTGERQKGMRRESESSRGVGKEETTANQQRVLPGQQPTHSDAAAFPVDGSSHARAVRNDKNEEEGMMRKARRDDEEESTGGDC
eukprot:9471009-Pyramimonas_sp.AAC.3